KSHDSNDQQQSFFHFAAPSLLGCPKKTVYQERSGSDIAAKYTQLSQGTILAIHEGEECERTRSGGVGTPAFTRSTGYRFGKWQT
ncbi:MAG: hypothetical protein RRX88_07090, partial [Raoultibacter sp.]